MDCREFGLRVRRMRERRTWTQEQLGERMADKSKERFGVPISPVSRSTIHEYEDGGRPPRPDYALLLCYALEVTAEALALEELLTADSVTRTVAQMERRKKSDPAREVAKAVPAADVAPPLMATPDTGLDWERMGLADHLYTTRRLDDRTVEDLHQLADLHLELSVTMEPRLGLEMLHRDLGTLRRRMSVAESERHQRELGLLAGQTAIRAGQLWHTMQDYGMAMESFGFALDLAHELSESTIRAMGLIALSLLYPNQLHEEEGLPAERDRCVKIIDAAERVVGPTSSPHLRFWLYCTRSWMHAGLQSETAANHDLDAASRVLGQPIAWEPGFFTPWRPYYLNAAAGKCAYLLGNMSTAIPRFEAQLQDWELGDGTRPYAVFQLAIACVRAREVERAGFMLMDTADTYSSSAQLLHRIRLLVNKELAPYAQQPSVRALRERLGEALSPSRDRWMLAAAEEGSPAM
jgi:transcriptional regulator with XRE-family HTH domain